MNKLKTEYYLTASGAKESDLLLKGDGREAREDISHRKTPFHMVLQSSISAGEHFTSQLFHLGHNMASLFSNFGSQTSTPLPHFSFYYCYATQNLNKVPDSLLSFKYAAIIQVVWPMKCKPATKELVSSMMNGTSVILQQ